MNMTKVTLNTKNTSKLTDAVEILVKRLNVNARGAANNSKDTVYSVYNPVTRMNLDFCIKKRDGIDYANWACVKGPAEAVSKFLAFVEYVEPVAEANFKFR